MGDVVAAAINSNSPKDEVDLRVSLGQERGVHLVDVLLAAG